MLFFLTHKHNQVSFHYGSKKETKELTEISKDRREEGKEG